MKQAKRFLVVWVMVAMSMASTGCVVGKNYKGVVYGVDTGLVIGGGALAIAGATEDCMPQRKADPLYPLYPDPITPMVDGMEAGACVTGKAAMIGGGLTLAAIGVLSAILTAAADDNGATEQQPDGTDPGAVAAQAALERADCAPHVQAYRAERSSRERAWMLGEMPEACRARARAAANR
jgi:hypothetical protein